MSIKDNLLTRKQAAEYLGFVHQTLAKWASQGGGPKYLLIGGRAYYRKSDLDAWVNSCERTHA